MSSINPQIHHGAKISLDSLILPEIYKTILDFWYYIITCNTVLRDWSLQKFPATKAKTEKPWNCTTAKKGDLHYVDYITAAVWIVQEMHPAKPKTN